MIWIWNWKNSSFNTNIRRCARPCCPTNVNIVETVDLVRLFLVSHMWKPVSNVKARVISFTMCTCPSTVIGPCGAAGTRGSLAMAGAVA